MVQAAGYYIVLVDLLRKYFDYLALKRQTS